MTDLVQRRVAGQARRREDGRKEVRNEDAALLKSVADQIPGRTICAFGEACSWPTQSFIAKFGDEFKNYPETKKAPKSPDALELV